MQDLAASQIRVPHTPHCVLTAINYNDFLKGRTLLRNSKYQSKARQGKSLGDGKLYCIPAFPAWAQNVPLLESLTNKSITDQSLRMLGIRRNMAKSTLNNVKCLVSLTFAVAQQKHGREHANV